MLRSMYSGISGMKGFQTKLDVIGNNIANVNTNGFKKGRVTFQDMMSQTTRGAQGPVENGRGGINPMQVGLGSKVGTIDNIHTQGFTQPTGSGLDLAIEGNGMFVLRDGEGANATEYYTRAGNFYLDEDGYIVNTDGFYVIGVDGNRIQIDENTVQSYSIATDGTVNIVDNTGAPDTVGQIALANFSNPAGLEKVGNNLFLNSQNAGLDATDGRAILHAPDSGTMGKTVAGALEMSNVDLAEEFTEMIVAQRGFQANTRIITTSDEILQELVNLKR